MVIEAQGSPPPTPFDRDATVEHVARNRAAIRQAFNRLSKVCRGRMQGDGQIGYDHTVDPARPWWARVHLQGNRAVQEFLVEGHESAVAAIEALTVKVGPIIRRLNRHR